MSFTLRPHQERQWFIYTLSDPRTGEVRYVGQTVSPKHRLRQHISEGNTKHINAEKTVWLKDLQSLGLKPLMCVIDTASKDSWADTEKKWIAFYRSINPRLTNLSPGGEGCRGFIPGAETRLKMSKSHLGKVRTAESRARMSIAQTGLKKKPPTQEMRDAMSELHPFKAKNICKFGHEFNEENTYTVTRKKNGRNQRKCRKCRAIAQLAYTARKRAA